MAARRRCGEGGDATVEPAVVRLRAAFGERPGESAYAARLRGYGREVDVEAVGGWRAGDAFGGAATRSCSARPRCTARWRCSTSRPSAVRPSSAGRAPSSRSWSAVRRVCPSARACCSTPSITIQVSGCRTPRTSPALFDPEFVTRVVRGDTQILTRHAVAVVGSYEWSPTVAASASVVQEPTDGSGVFAPSLTLTFGDRWSVLASGYLAYGRPAAAGVPQSAYGSAQNSVVVQLRCYR